MHIMNILCIHLTLIILSLHFIFVKKQSQELTRVNPDRNIFSINVELTSTFLLYRGLVHHHHRILKLSTLAASSKNIAQQHFPFLTLKLVARIKLNIFNVAARSKNEAHQQHFPKSFSISY